MVRTFYTEPAKVPDPHPMRRHRVLVRLGPARRELQDGNVRCYQKRDDGNLNGKVRQLERGQRHLVSLLRASAPVLTRALALFRSVSHVIGKSEANSCLFNP